MNNKYSISIVGAGAAGLFAGAFLALEKNCPSVMIFEMTATPGNKLLLSGTGRCNITHDLDIKDFFSHYGRQGKFLRHALYSYPPDFLIEFFKDKGLDFTTEKNGKIFARGGARDVLEILLDMTQKAKIKIQYNSPVLSISKEKKLFKVKTQEAEYLCEAVILCAGGKSYPDTGSRGDAYRLALGHKVTVTTPALTPVFIRDFKLSRAAGISFENLSFKILKGNELKMKGKGRVLITHRGFSGPAILDASRYMEDKDILKINFTELPSASEFKAVFEDLKIKQPKKSVLNGSIFTGLPLRLLELLVEEAGLPQDLRLADINKKQMEVLCQKFCEYRCSIESKGGYQVAMATAGGIDLSQIDSKTMMSTINPGMFFAGEYMDIDGDTGGYNLQTAFSTAFLAAKACLEFVRNK